MDNTDNMLFEKGKRWYNIDFLKFIFAVIIPEVVDKPLNLRAVGGNIVFGNPAGIFKSAPFVPAGNAQGADMQVAVIDAVPALYGEGIVLFGYRFSVKSQWNEKIGKSLDKGGQKTYNHNCKSDEKKKYPGRQRDREPLAGEKRRRKPRREYILEPKPERCQ